VSLAGSYLRAKPGRTSVLTAGFCVATVAFALLAMNAVAPIVQVAGALPQTTPSRAYDIVVGPSGAPGDAGSAGQADLSQLTGGITLGQYSVIRRLAGVQVAAPMTMVGYVPMTVTVPVTVPASALRGAGQLLVVTASKRGNDVLGAAAEQGAGISYLTAQPAYFSTGNSRPRNASTFSDGMPSLVCPAGAGAGGPSSSAAAGAQPAACWSASSGPGPKPGSAQPAAVSVPVSWTFLLPLVAIDPVAESKLLHLSTAVISGRYLTTDPARPGSAVPVIMASSLDDEDAEPLVVSRLPASAARSLARARTADQFTASLAGTGATVVGTRTLAAADAYRLLLGSAAGSASAVPAYWTTGAVTLTRTADGDLVPQPGTRAPAAASGDPFVQTGTEAQAPAAGLRAVAAHLARAAGQRSPGAALTVVGVFNPARIASSPATPSPYRSAALPGADPRSRRLLGGRPLSQDADLAGYPGPAATLVMPLQDIGAFTGHGYTGTESGKPIGSIRVRVAGVTGDGRLSLERVRAVAQEIVRATGLRVGVTLAATSVTRTVDVPALSSGEPAVRVSQVWYRSDAAVTVTEGLDPRRIALSVLVLPVAVVFLANGARAVVLGRRPDLAILRALGWRRRGVRLQLLLEFGLIAVGGWLLAVLVAGLVGLALPAGTISWWALLAMPAALAMALTAAAWYPGPQPGTRPVTVAPTDARSGTGAGGSSRVAGRALRRLRRAPGRKALAVLVIALACLALAQVLVVRWGYGGVLAGSALGHPVVWQSDAADVPPTITVMALAMLATADLYWLSLTESAAEFRTLRAIGWPAHGLAGLVAADAVVLGLLGGAAAGAAELCACAAVVHRLPAGLLAVTAALIAAGIALSITAAGIAAIIRPGRGRGTAGEPGASG
jgi:putative ABC transport system permease protein